MKRAEHQPVSDLTLYAGIFLKTWSVADRGTLLPQHAHRYDHITLVVSGSVRVFRGDDAAAWVGDFVAPQVVRIPALEKHSFLTLTDDVVLACIHATDAAEAEIAEEHNFTFED